ncbi:MAG: hypothetical protein J07HQW1_02023 [Haloquadratum walsbyi J07HQW1]|uniref:Uncharacterized protein n=1 Tax=Haloquadratum walsbyi J07HQW1 TaxID=1238424 RepID=U1MPU3_9EURY|nr:MAG: hypothetical protein J07HQW1_02023 [Haloquadratum walsbyi J07HQW1]
MDLFVLDMFLFPSAGMFTINPQLVSTMITSTMI